MAIKYLILLSRQGKVRLTKWYITLSQKEKQRIVREVAAMIPLRKPKMCNVIEHKDSKIIYRRYASLFFICSVDNDDNELITLDIIQRYVEIMDKSYGNVCELDIIFNFQTAYHVLDELIIDGVIQESSASEILKKVAQQDQLESGESLQR
ncbi:unnamed protein product [Ambrosiozyma monospora]|uniref:AP complex subunit sigma n=1 Tax=Ambrosiozyma monospora TaxID=43982 RepID=A0A9W7DJ83_AMBMO|nr:unnamed protein product [Ambrosiozyma monospora]